MQRNASSNANITVTGTVTGTHSVEARFNQGPWVAIANSVSGSFSAVLSNQFQGQGYLQARLSDSPNDLATVQDVGIGEVFIIAGQSNAVGHGANNQYTWARPFPMISLFGNDYAWKTIKDPTDSSLNQIDTVSSDAAAAGSIWPYLGGIIQASLSVPVAFVPCAKGSSQIAAWQLDTSPTNRASLLGSMTWRANVVGGARAVLFWDGETDAEFNVNQATWFNGLTNFSAQVKANIGCKIMPCKLQHMTFVTDPQQAEINNAVAQAWSSDTNTLTGPDLSVINTMPEDDTHIKPDSKLQAAASLWFSAIKAANGW